jgi:hypothetical protein
MKTIRNRMTGIASRIDSADAERLVASGDFHYCPKKCKRRNMNLHRPAARDVEPGEAVRC